MKLLIFVGCLLSSVLATGFGSNSAVITGQDVRDGLDASKLSLTPGGKYRVYAVYARSAPSEAYARNVVIRGADNGLFTVAALAMPKPNTGYILDNSNEIIAPVTITDNNPEPATGFSTRVPFTIYLVSVNYAVAPVVSAQLLGIQVDSSLAILNSPSCTILSAEMAVWLSDIVVDTSTMDSIDVKSAGYDAISNGYTIMTVAKESAGSSVVISSPIATLYNRNAVSTNFTFVVSTEGIWSGPLSPGASTAFLSNGWLSASESYRMEYSNEFVRARSYDFGREVDVCFAPAVGNYFPDAGDSIKFTCGKDNGKSTDYNCGALVGFQQKDRCMTIALSVLKGTIDGPRFKVEIDTNSVFSKSIFVLLMVLFYRVLNC